MKVEKILSKDLKREYHITIPASDISEKINKRLADISKTLKMPGFRPGKVPLDIVKKNYGGNVTGEVVEQAIDQSTRDAIKKEGLKPALYPHIEIVDFKEGSDLKYKMEIEVLPEVPELNLAKISVEKFNVEISEDDINEGLGKITTQLKDFSPVKDGRAAKKGDAVLIDFKGFLDDKAFPGGEAKGHRLQLGSNSFIPGFEDQLVGSKAGDDKIVEVTFPELYHAKDLAGKKAKFEVKVHEVQEEKPTAIDEALAKRLGFEDVAGLKAAVKDQIEKEVAEVTRTDAKKNLFDELEKALDFGIPEGMLKQEFDAVWKTVQNAKKSNPDSPELQKSDAELEKEYRKMAERRVRLGILLADLGVKNKIAVTNEDINAAVMEEARSFPGQEGKVIEHYKKHPEQIDALRGPILEEKVVDFMLGKVSIKEKRMALKEFRELKDKEAEESSGGADKKKKKK